MFPLILLESLEIDVIIIGHFLCDTCVFAEHTHTERDHSIPTPSKPLKLVQRLGEPLCGTELPKVLRLSQFMAL